jgi:DNA ligase (NAD+)
MLSQGEKMSRKSELRSLIMRAKQAYYYGGQAIMSDAQYDALEDELRILSPDDPVLAIVGAPVPSDGMLTKASHKISMGSQGKVNSKDQFVAWYEKHAKDHRIHVSLKGDGASAAAYYENGNLTQVISRGDGKVGEDITANAIKFKGLPAYVTDSTGPFSGAVRFEVILTVEDWGKVDPDHSTNPRNLGSGIMGRKNGRQSELLTIFAFDIDESTGGVPLAFSSELEKSQRLEELGFNLIPYQMCASQEEVIAYFERIAKTRSALPIWIDGLVLKIDSIQAQQELGVTSGRPKGQIAWKFDSEGAETVLLSVSISGGHTGALIPIAHFEPLTLGGTTVRNASLANWDEIERLDLAIGDRIWVIKANDIIPKIIRVTQKNAPRTPIEVPQRCPFCAGLVGRRLNTGGGQGVILECQNSECPKKSMGKIKRWVKSLDIQGIGDSVLQAMVEQLDLADVSGLYTLRDEPDRLAALIINAERDIRLGEKRAATLLKSIDASRNLTLVQFLGSLGVDRLGKRRMELIVKASGNKLNTLQSWRSGALRDPLLAQQVGVPNMGDALQDGVDVMSDLIDALIEKGVKISSIAATKIETSSGRMKSVCITGKMPSGKKKSEYKAPLFSVGYQLVDKVSKDLDLLVLADPNSQSRKAQKARKMGVVLISEEELQSLIQSE